jgi:hypothetical protein
MVIITYENLDGWGGTTSYPRNPATFMSQLKTFWNNYSSKTALYEPANTTVANARGKLFCIARPTSAYFDDRAAISDGTRVNSLNLTPTEGALNVATENCHEHILVVNGWGSLKDKWEARGYTNNVFNRGKGSVSVTGADSSKPGRPFDVSTMTYKRESDWSWTEGIIYRYFWDGNEPVPANYTAQVATVKTSSANFYYGTQAGVASSVSKTAWVQEWARVAPEGTSVVIVDYIRNGKSVDVSTVNSPELDDYYKCVYWAPTIEEKEQRIEETLNYAINKSLSGVNLYINSLCGYFIDSNIPVSIVPNSNTDFSGSRCNKYGTESNILTNYWKVHTLSANNPQSGMAGDIDTYSKYINNYFYKLISDKQSNGELNSGIGIVLMDRVSNSAETDPAGYYIPQIIWSNNSFN